MSIARRSTLVFTTLALSTLSAFAGSVHRAVVTRIAPAYPDLAKRMHVSGKVIILVTVQPDGSVSATKVESGHALLTAAAQDAVRRWRFAPGSDSTETEVEINFTEGQ